MEGSRQLQAGQKKLYRKVKDKEPNLTINMYKKARKFDQMVRLVST